MAHRPLVPPSWTADCLSYMKDLEVLATKKTETAKKASKVAPPTAAQPSSTEPDGEASLKRKPRFPKRPKSKAAPDA